MLAIGAVGAAGLVLAACVVLRFLAHPDLWLDEALSVNIARPPIFHGLPSGEPSLLEALRHDGSPPLYYLLLHAWMQLVGTGDFAVRSLSSVVAALTLPVAWVAGRRVGGKATAWGLLLLLASSPFVIRYASETRMYSMLVLFALVLYLAWTGAMRRPTLGRLLGLAGATGLLLLTHYWAFYLLGALAGVTVLRAVGRGKERLRTAALALLAMGAGAIPFLPWLPSFLFQLHHTGTPWGNPPTLKSFRSSLQIWTDSGMRAGIVLRWILIALSVAAVLHGRGRISSSTIRSKLGNLRLHASGSPSIPSPTSSPAAPADSTRASCGDAREGSYGDAREAGEAPWWHGLNLCLLVLGTFALAIVTGKLFHVSFAARYTSVVVPLFLLLAALGLRALPGASKWVVLGVAVACGLFVAVTNVDLKRTQTGDLGRVLRSKAVAGDLIVYCPDQLGPGTSRQAPASVSQVTFPSFGAPGLVDWVDYAQRHSAADPGAFAREADRRAAGSRVWLVFSARYNVASPPCARLTKELAALRPPQKVVVRPNYRAFEAGWLLLYEPTPR